MLGASGLADKLRKFQLPNKKPFIIYGDPAYDETLNVLSLFPEANLTDDQQGFNAQRGKLRVDVECSFRKICSDFAILDFKKNLKVLLQHVAIYYLVVTILT